MSKIWKWKQFTTKNSKTNLYVWLFLICQRYENESNSQPEWQPLVPGMSCFWYVKDMKMKAIHNEIRKRVYTFELFLICQRYENESNSQRKSTSVSWPIGCFWYVKDMKMKAIHNGCASSFKNKTAVSDMSKIWKWKQFTTNKRIN